MRYIIPILALLIAGECLGSEKLLREIRWEKAPEPAAGAEMIPAGPETKFNQLKITGQENQQTSTLVLTLENPGVQSANYALEGQIRYEAVEGTAYLEMWNYFPDGGMFFTRTLDKGTGPMQQITGTSDWRPVVLPFHSKPEYHPSKLTLSVVLPGKGTIYLGPMRLVTYEQGAAATVPGQWWTQQQGGLIGGVFGAVVGLIGGLIGVLASQGKARGLALGIMSVLVGLGVAILVLGLVALVMRQPYHVYYPLLLMGFLCTVVVGSLFPAIKRRYAEAELRRMRALDARG